MTWFQTFDTLLREASPRYTPIQCFSIRVVFVIFGLFAVSLGPVMVTLEIVSKYHLSVTSYNKYQSSPWEIHVANINQNMFEAVNTTIRCKSTFQMSGETEFISF